MFLYVSKTSSKANMGCQCQENKWKWTEPFFFDDNSKFQSSTTSLCPIPCPTWSLQDITVWTGKERDIAKGTNHMERPIPVISGPNTKRGYVYTQLRDG